jgi:DNA polymerase-3 subunit beta
MKFGIDTGSLAETINAAISSIATKTTAPILGGVLIEAQIGTVTFSSFNYDRATIRVAPADVMDTDTMVVSGRLLATVAGNLPKSGEATVVLDGGELSISAGRTHFRLPVMRAEDYPHLPVLDSRDVIGTVDRDVFTEAAKIVGGFASTDVMPANLSALNLLCTTDTMTLRATDRYIIGNRRIPWSGKDVEINVVASDLLATIKALSGHATGDIEVLSSANLFGLRTPTTTVITRVLDAEETFPDTGRIMRHPQFFAAATVDVGDLQAMLKRAMAVADDNVAQVDLEVDDGALSVTTTHSSAGNISDGLDAVHYGGTRRVAVSSRRLYNALAIIDDPKVTVAFRDSGLHIHLHPGDIDESLEQPDTETIALVGGIKAAPR